MRNSLTSSGHFTRRVQHESNCAIGRPVAPADTVTSGRRQLQVIGHSESCDI